jgi:hypothetical protein
MEDVVDTFDGGLRDVQIGQVALDELGAGQMLEVPFPTGDEVIDDTDTLTAPDELLCKVGTNEACSTCDQV